MVIHLNVKAGLVRVLFNTPSTPTEATLTSSYGVKIRKRLIGNATEHVDIVVSPGETWQVIHPNDVKLSYRQVETFSHYKYVSMSDTINIQGKSASMDSPFPYSLRMVVANATGISVQAMKDCYLQYSSTEPLKVNTDMSDTVSSSGILKLSGYQQVVVATTKNCAVTFVVVKPSE